jgi:hypothetical protein
MKAITLTMVTIGILSGVASASPFPFNLFERQVNTCPQLPPVKDELLPRAELEKLVKGLSLNGTGANLGQTPVAEKPKVKLELPKNFEKLQALAPNNTAMFSRSRINNRLSHPWNTIGKVWVYAPSGITHCTATLVAPNIILTAGHCLPGGGRWNYLEFVPAYDGEDANPRPFGTAYSTHCFGYSSGAGTGLDYKTCRLNTDIGRLTGTMGYLGWWNDGPYQSGLWTAVGYPLEYRSGHVPVVQEGIRIDDVDDESDACGKELEEYNVYATPGWDGGPMFRIFPGGGGAIAGVVSGNENDYSFWDLMSIRGTVHAGGVCMLNIIAYTISIWTP